MNLSNENIIEIIEDVYERASRDSMNPDNYNSLDCQIAGIKAVVKHVLANDPIKEQMREALESCWYHIANHSSNDRCGHDTEKTERAKKAYDEEKKELSEES